MCRKTQVPSGQKHDKRLSYIKKSRIEAQRSGFNSEKEERATTIHERHKPLTAKNQIKAQRSGFDLERKNNTIGRSDAACGGWWPYGVRLLRDNRIEAQRSGFNSEKEERVSIVQFSSNRRKRNGAYSFWRSAVFVE